VGWALWFDTRLTGVDLVVHVARLDEEDILVDTAGLDVGFVTHSGPAEPRGRASVDGADVESSPWRTTQTVTEETVAAAVVDFAGASDE
jgi:hypothetical protein